MYEDIITCYKYWPKYYEKQLNYSELRRSKPEQLVKENKPFLKVIWYQKHTTNLLPKQRTDIFLDYAGNANLYFFYPILAFSFFAIALKKDKLSQRAIFVFCGSIFLALMLIVLQLRYMQWKEELKLKYDNIKQELIKQTKTSTDNYK